MSTIFVKAWLAASSLQDRLRREDGQALTEYALVLGLIVAATVGTLALIGGRIGLRLSAIYNALAP